MFGAILAVSSVARVAKVQNNGDLKFAPLSHSESFRYVWDASWRIEIARNNVVLSELALDHIQELIRNAPLDSSLNGLRARTLYNPQSMQFHPTIRYAKEAADALESCLSLDPKSPEIVLIKRLKIKLQACRLGILVEEMASAAGFPEWSKTAFLYLRLARYNERVWFTQDGHVCIKHKNSYTLWEDIPADAKEFKKLPSFFQCPYMVAHPYLMEGVVSGYNVYEWSSLRQTFQETPEEIAARGGGYAVSIRTSTNDGGPRVAQGDHSWVSLHTADGKVHAIGLYRPDKMPKEKSVLGLLTCGHLKVKLGTVIEDWSEFYDDNITNLTIGINAQQFQAMKAKIESDHKRGAPFHLTEYNCSRYALSVIRCAGIDMCQPFFLTDDFVDSAQLAQLRSSFGDAAIDKCDVHHVETGVIKESYVRYEGAISPNMYYGEMFTPLGLYRAFDAVYHLLPNFARVVPDALFTIFWNIVQVLLGSSEVHEELTRRGVAVKAPYGNWLHVFMFWRKASVVPSPYLIGQVVTPAVKRVRSVLNNKMLIPKAWVVPGEVASAAAI